MKTLPFIKMHGLGNDYVYIDCFPPETAKLIARTDLPALARKVSDRHLGIGSDGLVLIMPSTIADARMRIFNADGSEAQMCGNAIRCVGKYLYESMRCLRTNMRIETLSGVRTLNLLLRGAQVGQVRVDMGVPQLHTETLILPKAGPLGFTAVDMGNPHAVFFRDQRLSDSEFRTLGPLVSTHPYFSEGTNVEFVCVRDAHTLDVRVWERGSGETQACGTGACAAAAAAIRRGGADSPVIVRLPGGELTIEWDAATMHIYMTGPAEEAFQGTFQLAKDN